ncbi:MAG: cadherin repeat domain-containing protein [Nitrosomonadaceae bacterium]
MKQIFWIVLLTLSSLSALKADDFYTPQILGGATTFLGSEVVAESNIAIYDGHLAVAFVEVVDGDENISLWLDDGTGNGTAGDGVVHADEIRKSFIKKNTLVYSVADGGAAEDHDDWGGDLAMRVVNGKISMAFRSFSGDGDPEIYTWHDVDDDLVVGQGEWHEHSHDYVPSSRSLDVAYTDRFAITSVGVIGNHLVLGSDSNGNGIVNKIRGCRTGMAYNTMVGHNGVVHLFYQDLNSGELRLWRDTNTNFKDNEGYTVIDDATNDTGVNARAKVLDGNLAVSYFDAANGDLKWWVDQNNDGVVDASEKGSYTGGSVIEYGKYSDILMFNGHTAIVFTKEFISGTVRLCVWIDDGADSGPETGTADDNVAQKSEIRMLAIPPMEVGYNCRAVEYDGDLYITYTDMTNSRCMLTAYTLSAAPTIAANQSFHVDENTANNTAIYNVVGTADHPVYSEVGGNGAAYFKIGLDGTISVQDKGGLDYETMPHSYTYTVRVEDEVTHASAQTTVTIYVDDVYEEPPVIADVEDQTFTLSEGEADGTVVGSLVFVGDDAVITGGTGEGFFSFDIVSGDITVTNNAGIDYDGSLTVTLEFEVTESSTQTTSTAVVTIELSATPDPEVEAELRDRNVGTGGHRKHHDQFTAHKINPCLFTPAQGTKTMLVIGYCLLALIAFGLVTRRRTV